MKKQEIFLFFLKWMNKKTIIKDKSKDEESIIERMFIKKDVF